MQTLLYRVVETKVYYLEVFAESIFIDYHYYDTSALLDKMLECKCVQYHQCITKANHLVFSFTTILS